MRCSATGSLTDGSSPRRPGTPRSLAEPVKRGRIRAEMKGALLSILLAVIPPLVPAAARGETLSDPDAIYRRASVAYESGNYNEAVSLYLSLVSGDFASDTLYLNLGTAYFRAGSPGKAALWFRRAAHLNPSMPEIRQNFEFLRRSLGLLEFADAGWQRFLLRLAPAPLRWAAWVFLWAALFALYGAVGFARWRNRRSLLVAGAILATALSAGLFWVTDYRADRLAPANFATVVAPGTAALVSPAPDAAAVISLPEGSELRVLEDTGPWLYAAVPGGVVGWVHHGSIERNWPIPEEASADGKS